MSRPWTAEIEVTADLAAALVDVQFGRLAPACVELLGVGWDNTAFLVNGRFVFRFPRRQIAVALLETETRLLPFVGPRLPLAAPLPEFVGRPEDRYPWPFAGYRKLAGRTACRAALTADQRALATEPLGRFLRALHAIDCDEAARLGARPDGFGRLDAGLRGPKLIQRLEQLAQIGLVGDVRPWLSLVAATPPPPEPSRFVLVHGDLYARHLLVDDERRLTGVIDWGDMHLSSPAADLAVACGFLPPGAHEEFRRAYGAIDERDWLLARFRALDAAATLLVYGHDTSDADLVREGQWAFAQLESA